MESLAYLVAGLLLGMLTSSLLAFIVSWRARTRRMRIVAIVLGVPGALLGAVFVSSANTPTGALIGLIGVSGIAVAAYRLWRTPGELTQD